MAGSGGFVKQMTKHCWAVLRIRRQEVWGNNLEKAPPRSLQKIGRPILPQRERASDLAWSLATSDDM